MNIELHFTVKFVSWNRIRLRAVEKELNFAFNSISSDLQEGQSLFSRYLVVSLGLTELILPLHKSSQYAWFLIHLHLSDIYLRILVKSPFHIELGGKGVLKVEKSDGGVLWWIHRGNLVRGQDSHYTFLDTQGSTGTELEISNAGEEQGGFYEVVLKEAGCEVRNVIDVQIDGEYSLSFVKATVVSFI